MQLLCNIITHISQPRLYSISTTFYFYSDIILINPQFPDSITHLLVFLSALLSPFVPSVSLQRVSHSDSVAAREGWRETRRDCIVVCSYLIINPHWSVSTPGPLFSLHSTTPSDKVAGWSVAGHGGFVYINDSETASSWQWGWSYITINHQRWQDGFDNIPPLQLLLLFSTVRPCTFLSRGLWAV